MSQRRSYVRFSNGSSMTAENASFFKVKGYLCKNGGVQYKNKERFTVTIEANELSRLS